MAPKVKLTIERIRDGVTDHPEVEGYLVAPGLAVHKALMPDGTMDGSMWNVTHIESGRRLCGSLPTRKAAMEVAEAVAPFADWTVPDGKQAFGGDLPGKVLAVRNRIFDASGKSVGSVKAVTTVPLQDVVKTEGAGNVAHVEPKIIGFF